MKLISHELCPYVQRAVITLQEKQAAYERIDIDLANKPDWFLQMSPLGKTPVLQVGDAIVFESAVICEYLEDTLWPKLHPVDPLERAQHRAWIECASATLAAIWNLYTAKDDADFDKMHQALMNRLSQIERTLGEGPYFAGERFSLVDSAFAPALRYFDLFERVPGVDVFNGMPKTIAWRSALSQRPSVKAAVRSDYLEKLREFVIRQDGVMGRRLAELS